MFDPVRVAVVLTVALLPSAVVAILWIAPGRLNWIPEAPWPTKNVAVFCLGLIAGMFLGGKKTRDKTATQPATGSGAGVGPPPVAPFTAPRPAPMVARVDARPTRCRRRG